MVWDFVKLLRFPSFLEYHVLAYSEALDAYCVQRSLYLTSFVLLVVNQASPKNLWYARCKNTMTTF